MCVFIYMCERKKNGMVFAYACILASAVAGQFVCHLTAFVVYVIMEREGYHDTANSLSLGRPGGFATLKKFGEKMCLRTAKYTSWKWDGEVTVLTGK